MAKQQTKRRKKRYDPGSVYAGDVKPTGVLRFLGGSGTIKVVFIAMIIALMAGGLVSIFASGVLGGRTGHSNPAGFEVQTEGDDEDEEPADDPVIRQYSAPPPLTIDPTKQYTATITTALGQIEIELAPGQAPETVNNFVFLVRDGFYNGLIFHSANSGFSAQAGDPACLVTNLSCRGSGGPGYDLEETASGSFQQGTLGMVNGSQFFIALTESSQFDDFTPFGNVVSGLDVAAQLSVGTEIQGIEIFEQ